MNDTCSVWRVNLITVHITLSQLPATCDFFMPKRRGGKEYAIVGNVLYNAWSSTVNDFVDLVAGVPKDYVKGKVVDEVRNKALTEGVASKLPDTGNIVELGNIAVDSYNFGGDLYQYLKERK